MWLQAVSHWLLVATMVSQVGPGPALGPPTPPPLPELIATRQAVFAIPYRLERTEDTARPTVEVQLYVSVDRGAHWQFYAKQSVGQVANLPPQFPFRAGGDGEFWFAIRTIDRGGLARPETVGVPGLRVLVDTKPPVLRLTAQPRPDGQVSVRFEIDEPNPKPNSLRIVYRPAPTEPWQAVPVDPQTVSTSGGHQSGQLTFWPKPGSSDLMIRAEVSDVAGNSAAAQSRVRLPPAAGPPPRTAAVGPQSPLAGLFDKPAAKAGPGENAEPRGSVAIAINPPIGNRYGATGEPSGGAAIPGLPPGERPRWVNSRLFELEYDVDSVGPSGIGRVELWGTQDGGKTWRSYPLGNSRRSPLLVNVDEEGIYGFRVVVSNGAGVGGKPPRSGDLPDLWIGVDLTKPTTRIISAQQGVDAEAGHLIISWQADDRMLAARPVSLSFSQTRGGPWLPIASGLENTGRYAWPIDNRSPPQVYLRIEVRDEAGNVGVHELTEPITIDQSRPTVRIRDVRPLGDSGARSACWR